MKCIVVVKKYLFENRAKPEKIMCACEVRVQLHHSSSFIVSVSVCAVLGVFINISTVIKNV